MNITGSYTEDEPKKLSGKQDRETTTTPADPTAVNKMVQLVQLTCSDTIFKMADCREDSLSE